MFARLVHRLLTLVPVSTVEALRRRPRVAAIADRLVSIVSRRAHGAVVTIPAGEAGGLQLRLGPVSSVWTSGRVESSVQRALAQTLTAGHVFFDIGANLGFFTVLAARLVGPVGRVVAFEPHPAHVAALRDNVALNGFTNVKVVQAAISDASAERSLEASAAPTASIVAAGTREALTVPAIAIDDLVAADPDLRPDVIKIDVEGHEVEALRGMERTLALHRPVVICELHGRNAEVAAILSAAGYSLDVLDSGQPLEHAPPWVHVLARPVKRDDSRHEQG